MERALALIEARLAEPVSLGAIARRAGFSLWHFQRVFAAYTGEPLGAYWRRRRLTAAVEALQRTRRTVAEIALSYRFESPVAFTRAFDEAANSTGKG